MNGAPSSGLPGPPYPKFKPKREKKKEDRSKMNPATGMGQGGTITTTATITSGITGVDNGAAASGHQNNEARKRHRPRKKKPLVGQLPEEHVGGKSTGGHQQHQQHASTEPKKIVLLKREAVSVEATGPPSTVGQNSSARKSADETKPTTSKELHDSARNASAHRPKSSQTAVLETVEDVKTAVTIKKGNDSPRQREGNRSDARKKSNGNNEAATAANMKKPSDAKGPAKEREPVNEEALPSLEKDFIFPLRTKHPRFPMAVYFCRLCRCHINSLKFAEGHMKTSHHTKAKDEYYLVELLDSIPSPPTRAHCSALNALLDRAIAEHGRSAPERMQCLELAQILTRYFRLHLHPTCMVRLYGSSYTSFALKDSNVNLELLYPPEFTHAQVLTAASKLMTQDNQHFSNVEPDFSAKWPYIKFNASGFGFFPERPVDCILSVCNTQAFEVSLLLGAYARHFPQLVGLAQFCRYWAKTCHLDDAQLVGLPPYAFDLMLVHYLQQRQPQALPVFHEMESFREPGANLEVFVRFCMEDPINFDDIPLMKEDEWNLGDLWVGFLKYYTVDFDVQSLVINIRSSKPITRAEKDWRVSRRLGIEDPFLSNKNVAQMTQNMFDYTLHCFRTTYKYFGLPQTAFGPLIIFNEEYQLVLRDVLSNLRQQRLIWGEAMGQMNNPWGNSEEIQKMLADLMKPKSSTDSVPEPEKPVEETKPSSHRYSREEMLNLHDEDHKWSPKWRRNYDTGGLPVTGLKQVKSAVRSMGQSSSADDIGCQPDESAMNGDGWISTATYVQSSLAETPSIDNEPVENIWAEQNRSNIPEAAASRVSHRSALISESSEVSGFDEEECGRLSELMAANCIAEGDEDTTGNEELSDVGGAIYSERESGASDCIQTGNDGNGISKVAQPSELQDGDQPTDENVESIGPLRPQRRRITLDPECLIAINELMVGDYYFIFSSAFFTDGQIPKVLCTFCNVVGHIAKNCPEKRLPPLILLLPLTPTYTITLDSFLHDLWRSHEITSNRMRWQEYFRADLEHRLQQTLRADTRLQLFGSSCNGFGFVRSDLDLCLTFGNAMTLSQDENPVKIIKLVANALRRDRDFRDVLPVTKAKVPIVRFFHYPSQLEGDISLYNCLALRNTHLLYTYSNIDKRVRALGYIVKVFAKFCDIGDASRGSLSSYAYVIMMLHYLQRTQPPVIPILQELHGHNGRQPVLVDGWDTYFYADIRSLPKGANTQSVHDLWLGFLRYYTEVFDAKDFVIQMRRTEPLTKFEKLWSDKPLAIEDPFDLNHNLASGLSWRMYIYIMKVFIQAREAFGHPRHERLLQNKFGNYLSYAALEKYFFEIALRQKEPPPKDRACKHCGHIGHFVDTCPQKRSNKKAASAENDDDDIEDDKNAGPSKAVKSASK